MRTLRTASFALVASTLLGLVGCGGTQSGSTSTALEVEHYRSRAASMPLDAEVALARAEAELFVPGGDTAIAAEAIAHARALHASPLRTRFLEAVEGDLHGHHIESLTAYLETLDLARTSGDPWASVIAEVSIASIVEYDDSVPNFVGQVQPVLERLFAEPQGAGPSARYAAGNILIELAYRRGDMEAMNALRTAQGCLSSFRIAGPFGPRQLLDFDRALPPEEAGPLAAEYNLGFGRGNRATREAEGRGCAVHLGNGPVGGAGTTYAEATINVPTAGTHTIRLETPNAVELFVDDVSVARIDRRTSPIGRTTFHSLPLSAGPHRVMVKLSTRHPNPVLIAAVLDGEVRSDDVELSAREVRTPHPLAHYLDVTRSMSRADWVEARERLGALDPATAPVMMLVLSTGVALSDPLRGADVARDDALRAVTEARERDSHAWYPVIQAARFEADNGRVREAIALLREGTSNFPDVLAFPLALVDLLTARGWSDQVEPVIAAMQTRVPDACRPDRAALNHALERGRMPEVDRLSEELMRCDARSDARLQRFVRQRHWDEAQAEVTRLAAMEPSSSRFSILDTELSIARARSDSARVDALLTELRTLMPQSVNVVLAEVDRRLAAGNEQAARTHLLEAFAAEPEAMTDLRRLARAVFHESPLEPYRRDGAEVIRNFQASGRTYENAPQVLVWDYTVTRLLPEGTILELTHQISRVQSEEAVDALGQFQAPGDALMLTLRTVKADGTRLEPDAIAGLEHIEMPSLEVGDYVEAEYVRVRPPAEAYDGGAVGDRFYFQSFEIPFDTSQLTLVVPADAQVRIDPRGNAPRTEERTEGDARVYHWEVHEAPLLQPEPGSVHLREFMPSIAWSVRAEWPQVVEAFRDILADRNMRDPAAERLVRQIVGDDRSTVEQRAQRIYHWLIDNVADTSDVFGQAAPMLSGRTGSRSRLFVYMLSLIGIEADLALVRSYAFDATPSDTPDDDTYGDLAIRVQGSTGPFWVETGLDHSAFGTISPLVRGQDALMLRTPFERTTVSTTPLEADMRTVDVDITLAANGAARATITETFRGVPAATWRGELENIADAQLERIFEENYVARLLPGARMESLRITGREDAEMPLIFRYEVDVLELGRVENGVRFLPSLFPSSLTPSFARLSERTRAQIIPPLAMDLDVHLHVPAGAVIEAPEDAAFDGETGASIRYTSSRTEGGAELHRNVRIQRARVQPAQYPAFAAQCRGADEYEAREVRVRMP
jgi:hypothetical protein